MLRFTRLCAYLAVGLLAILCTSCTGDDPAGPQASRSAPAAPSPTPDQALPSDEQALLDKVRAEGQVKVLVRLKLPQTPAERDAAESAIADAQDQLQAQLEPLDVQFDTRFKLYPLVSLEANEATLLHLFESSLVDRVHENQVRKPHS